jgi:RNA polymerase sigma factor (sigma-70 family)
MVHSLTFRMTGSLVDAEDLAQETFIRACDPIGEFRGASKFSTWLYRISVNTCLNWRQSEARRFQLLTNCAEEFAARHADGENSPGDQANEVQAALLKLPAKQRAAIVLTIYDGFLPVRFRSSQPPDFHAGQSASAAGEGQNIGNETGRAGRCHRVALGSGSAPAPQGGAFAAAVHVRGGGPGKTMKIQTVNLARTPKPAFGGGSGTGILPVSCRREAMGDFSNLVCRIGEAGSLLHYPAPFPLRSSGERRGSGSRERNEGGMATLIFIVLLAIMMILVTAESSALFHLHREVKFLEQQQNKRLDASQTNSVAVTKPDSK